MVSYMADREPENTSAPEPQPTGPPPAVIDIRGPDERSAQVQLAARWAERYAPLEGDNQRAARERFRITHDYVDDVIHGIEPQTTGT
jgi:hypothetical protein